MGAELRRRVPNVRPLPVLQRRRGTLVSVVGHGAFLAVLTLVGARTELPSFESPLILGELVTARVEPAAAPEPVPTEPSAVPAAEEPAPSPAPPAGEPETETEPVPTPLPQRDDEVPDQRTVEAPVEPLPAEPPSEPSSEELRAELPAPPVESVADTLETEPPQVAEGLPAAETPPSATEHATRSLASHEERAVRRRLSSWTGQLDAAAPASTLAWRDGGQQYTAVLKRVPAADAMSMEQLLVELTTQRDGERLVTELRMNRIAFSNFAQFIDRWDPQVQIHDDLIDGRFHSNTEIRVSRESGVQPVFNGLVTLAGGDVRTDGVGHLNRKTMFPAGVETRVRRIGLPPRAAAFDDGTVPAERVRRISHESLLTFHADGTFESSVAASSKIERGMLGQDPFYIVADEGIALHVRGTVNGKVLVYSPERIVIVDDIRYAVDPREPGADDYLGLVAERTVEIDGPEITGSGDLEVHASIYARNRFLVRDYRSRRSGTLAIYGSVTAGSVSATEPRFATRIEFDDRLTALRAPGFPLTDRYELDYSSGEWRVVDTP